MKDVKVKKLELLATVRANRKTHIADFEEAVLGYKEQAKAEIEKAMERMKRQIDELEAGEVLAVARFHCTLAVPQNHEKDYDQVIKMLEMSVDDELTIRADEFAMYVMDDWSWKEDFKNVTATYSNKLR
jgi:hypothetical protein